VLRKHACVVLLSRVEIVYILEVVRGRFPFETLKKNVVELKRRYPDTDKRARLIAQTDLFAGGSVCLPQRAGWLEEFVADLLAFPGRHDDQVDALTQGLAWGRQQWSRKVTVGFYRF
jgi:phage terminase large subunit-like protein